MSVSKIFQTLDGGLCTILVYEVFIMSLKVITF